VLACSSGVCTQYIEKVARLTRGEVAWEAGEVEDALDANESLGHARNFLKQARPATCRIKRPIALPYSVDTPK
jgi:hypothetical protein